MIDSLEKIDTNLDEYGIVFVMSSQLDKARQLWIGRFPALAFFRNGEYVKYNGDLTKAKTVFKWLTASKQLFVPDKVEEVNDLLLAKMVEREKSLFVFFYIENDIFSQQILRTLEELDNSVCTSLLRVIKGFICQQFIILLKEIYSFSFPTLLTVMFSVVLLSYYGL